MEKEYEFEFECKCMTPTSPSSDPNKSISPADELFLNGRLVPHSFPIKSRATTSRGSSIGSSLMSSRCNSTGSSRSGTTSCSSASDSWERKSFQKKLARGSHTWQLIPPAPVMDTTGRSRRRRYSGELGSKKRRDVTVSREKLGFCHRVFTSFLMTCRACHAMDPTAVLHPHDFGTPFEFE